MFIFSDIDKLDGTVTRFPQFGPNWSPQFFPVPLLISDHLTDFSVEQLVEEINRFRAEIEQQQDYDLMLRATTGACDRPRAPGVAPLAPSLKASAARSPAAEPWAFRRQQLASRTLGHDEKINDHVKH